MSFPVTICDLMTDPDLFGQQFSSDSWAAWRVLLAGFYGLPLDEQGQALFQRITALSEPVQEPLLELWLAVGRRGGKSQIAALVAVYEAAFKDYSNRLAPGEVGGNFLTPSLRLSYPTPNAAHCGNLPPPLRQAR